MMSMFRSNVYSSGFVRAWPATLVLLAASLLVLVQPAMSAYLRDVPQKLTQPDGTALECFASGDEHFNWLHDANGYVIIQDHTTGYYTYATKVDGELRPSQYIAGRVDPASVGLVPDIKPSPDKLRQIYAASQAMMAESMPMAAPSSGTINNLVVFIRFKNESEFTDQLSTYDNMFNSTASGVNSMVNFFHEASYNALNISTTFYPTPPGATVVSYQDTVNPRGYYQPYDATTNPIGYQGGDNGTERRDREHILLKNAVNAIASQVPAGLNLDGDNDGLVDNVCFIIYGSPTGWASLLWPHMWSLYSQTAYINGKRVYTFNFQLQTSLASSGVGVLCHEMMHSLGAPDLYHYSYDGMTPVGYWDLMEYNQNPPQHPSAYLKYRYTHWLSSIPEISAPGAYTLHPLTSSTNNCYKIASPNSSTEYYVVEYRRDTGTFESSLPGSGLIVYRINTARDGYGNADGPPDEVYVYRPDGTCTVNGQYYNANYSSDVGRTTLNDSTNPAPFLSDCSAGGLCISEVGSCGDTISFRLGDCGGGDSYEPDNTCETAKTILSGITQTHSIDPATDVDWVKFTLSETSSVLLQTSGPTASDTRMWLYSSCAGTLVEFDDDSGDGSYSLIDRTCAEDALPAGTYYVAVDSFLGEEEIPSYTISLSVTPCTVGGWQCSSDVPKAIPDTSTIYSDLVLADGGTISDVDVKVNITHTWDADLDVYLQHPDGTQVELFTDDGGSGDNFTDTILDDEAAISITSGTAPFTGSYRPEGSLSALDGKAAAGTWRLIVTDDSGADVGTLNSWCLRVNTGTPAAHVTNVTSDTPNGCYGPSSSPIGIKVVFSEPVYVLGSPQIELDAGYVTQMASYSSGSGSNTLTFTYTIQNGDFSYDLCYVSSGSLQLNGGLIQNFAGTNANTTLPDCGTAGSLSYNKDIAVDGMPPWSAAGPLECGYTSAVVDVPILAVDWECGMGSSALWYRSRPLSGGTWGDWTAYPGSYTTASVPFDTSTTGGDGDYEFFSIATDRMGNVEYGKSAAECATRVFTSALTAPILNPEPARTPGATNEISWISLDPVAGLYQAQCSQDSSFTTIEQDSGWLSRPPDARTFTGLQQGGDYHFRVRSGFELCPGTLFTWSQTNKHDFDTGVLYNVSSSESPGDVVLARGATPLFTDDFEDGGMDGWTTGSGSYTRSVTGDTAAAGTAYSLMLDGGSGGHFDGVSRDLGSLTPDSVTFYVRSGSTTLSDAYFVLGTGPSVDETAVFFYAKGDGTMGVYDGATFWAVAYDALRWYKVRLDFNWTAKTVDYSLDDQPLFDDIPFRVPSVASLTNLYLYNYSTSQAWWDQIEFANASGQYVPAGSITSPVISPTSYGGWGSLTYTKDTSAPETALTVDVLDGAGATLLADVASGTNLRDAGITAPQIKLRANLSTSHGGNTPRLRDWTVTSVGIDAIVASSDWSNVESSHQMPVCGLPVRSTLDAAVNSASVWMAFTAWGRVTVLDGDTFEINDGSGPLRVVAPGHSLQNGDYAAATGVLDIGSSRIVLNCETRLVRKLD